MRYYASVVVFLMFSACASGLEPEAAPSPDVVPTAVAAGSSLEGPPDPQCVDADFGGKKYWFCSQARAWPSAQSVCVSAGFTLATVDSATENSFIQSHIGFDAWLGGLDTAAEGQWRWSQTGAPFWQVSTGAAGDGTVGVSGSLFAKWSPLRPTLSVFQNCLSIHGFGGDWADEACETARPFVCEGDLCPSDPNKSDPGLCGCGHSEVDSDGDGAPDCADACPQNKSKVNAGLCGCESDLAEGDHDGDGVPDCLDECPNDARYVSAGTCGCKDKPTAAGTPCHESFCPGAAVCDGRGSCGDPAACQPDFGCTLRFFRTGAYWFCSTPRPFGDAREQCRRAGMDLVAIDDALEDDFVFSHGDLQAFIGAGDVEKNGHWSWLATDKPCAARDAYENWSKGHPKSGSYCASIDLTSDRHWHTVDCENAEPYICERGDACPDDPAKVSSGQCGCGIPDTDADGDGVADCLDACRTDAAKREPGVCGCGQSDADDDRDGVANCVDECPQDADATAGGTCGCPSRPAASGSACCDGVCGTGTCDGAGHCGALAASCAPANNCACEVVRVDGTAYWFCPCALTRDAADTACSALPGGHLVHIDNAGENQLVAGYLTGDVWLGGSDRASEGDWRWTRAQPDSMSLQFWSGDANGAPHFGRFAQWADGEPSGGAASSCAVMSGASATRGAWFDQACGTAEGFVCEVGLKRLDCSPLSLPDACETLGEKCETSRDDVNCTPRSEAFAEATDNETRAVFSACTRCANEAANPELDCVGPWPTATSPVPCSGSAAPPPAGSTCSSFSSGLPADHQFLCPVEQGSWATPYQSCETSSCAGGGECGLVFSCSICPEGQICECSTNNPLEDRCLGDGNICRSLKVCGTLSAQCAAGDTDDEPCREVELCAASTQTVDLTFDDLRPGSDLSPVPAVAIAQAFGPPDMPANATQVAADPPCPGSPDQENCPATDTHRWCHYDTPQELTQRDVEGPMRNGDSGDPGTVEFFFKPDVDYGYQVFPGPLGLMQFEVGANASLSAGAEIHVLGVDKSLEVIDFLLEARGGLHDAALDEDDICGISTGRSHLLLLEQFDILPSDFKIDLPNDDAQTSCVKALKDFQEIVDRVKKAYNDARELLRQYKDLSASDSNFGVGLDGLCDQIVSSLPFDFPEIIDCNNLRPEALLNSFVDYYVHLALDKLGNEVASRVADTIDVAFDATSLGLDFLHIQNTEEITLVNQTFAIGPIPVNLQVLFTAAYGLDLDGVARFQPSSLVRQVLFNGATPASADRPFAYVGAVAAPYAGAGLALFVGVGFDIGFAAAKVGIEGSVSLGKVGLPIEAGAGIAVAAEIDRRAQANDVDPDYVLVRDPPLIPLKKYSINATYKYGATLKIEDLLSGSIDVAVKLKFLFFSKKWKAHVARFKGFCTPENPKPFCTVDIFGGYGTLASIPFEMVDWGAVLMPSNFLQLKRIPQERFRPPGGQPFNAGRAGTLFYDSLCTCIPRFDTVATGQQVKACTRDSECCGSGTGDFCFIDPEANGLAKCSTCRGSGQSCNSNSDCCSDDGSVTCLDDPTDDLAYGTCQPKSVCLERCSADSDCDDSTVFGDLFCFTPTTGAPDYQPLPAQRNCRVVANPDVSTCVVIQ